ncbi:MAG: 1-phosphofructokinase [Symbiobacteriaceae bacterium]|jgi:tagatose 6-phosphate kinase|nr:1-phosphofructokinase [Symbiobacteriaceae bacterium]
MILAVSLNSAMDRTVVLPGRLAPGEIQRARSVDVRMGGKGLNVAWAAARLGAKVSVTGFAGGLTGRFLREECARHGIRDGLVTTAGESRACYMFASADGSPPTVVNEPGPTVSFAEVDALVATYTSLVCEASLVVLSGSLPPGAPADIYRRMIEIARRAGVHCILDSSGEPLREGIAANPWLIKPNADEFAALTGGPWQSPEALRRRCRDLTATGVANVVVSLGGEGALVTAGDQCWHVQPPSVQTANPTACGDIFVAGVAVRIDRGEPLLEGIRLGTACAAANAAHPVPYLPTPAELGFLLAGVNIRAD